MAPASCLKGEWCQICTTVPATSQALLLLLLLLLCTTTAASGCCCVCCPCHPCCCCCWLPSPLLLLLLLLHWSAPCGTRGVTPHQQPNVLRVYREGNRTPTKKPGAVVFILKAKPHDRFVRRGADLLHKVVLPLYQSLVGAAVTVKTLDGRYDSHAHTLAWWQDIMMRCPMA
jgi:hypothetical protein